MAIEVVLIGSNVDRERNVAHILRALLELADSLHVSRIVETPPQGLIDEGSEFLNVAAAMHWDQETAALKMRLVDIEVALGRDRSDPRSSVKSRTADIDPVLRLGSETQVVTAETLPAESYVRELVGEVLGQMGIHVNERLASTLRAVEIHWADGRLGREPATLTRVAEPAGP